MMPSIYEPVFEVSETQILGLGDRKLKEKVRIILNCRVMEKTKNYLILRINSGYLVNAKRKF